MASLFLMVGAVWAQTVAYTVDPSTGSGVTTEGWSKTWTYTTTDGNPAKLQLSSNANNMRVYDGLLALAVGTSSPGTYTLKVPNNYHIVSYSFDFKKYGEYTEDVTLTVNGEDYEPTAETQTVEVNEVNAYSTSFVLSGANKSIQVSNFVVNIELVPIEINLTTDESNPNWYTIKNKRGNVYAAFTGSGTQMKLNSSIENESYLFYFTEGANGGYKIHNAATSNLCAGHSSWNANGIEWYLGENANANHPGISISANADFSGNCWNNSGGNNTHVAYWSADDIGSSWAFEAYDGDLNELKANNATRLQMSTVDGEKHFYYIKNRRQNGKFANYIGAGKRFTQTTASTAGSYWYFVDAKEDLPAGTEVPVGYVACRIYNAGHNLAVENTSGYMSENSGVQYPAKIYFIRKHDNVHWDYVIYPYNETDAGWNDLTGTNVTNHSYNDPGSIWSIEASGKSESDLMNDAATAKTDALEYIELAELADYYTYSDDVISTAKIAIKDLDVSTNLVVATTNRIAIESAISTLKASQINAGPVEGDRVMLKNRSYGNWLSMTIGWDANALCGKPASTDEALLSWELQATDTEGVYYLYNEDQEVYAGPLPEWDNTNIPVTEKQAEAGKYQFVGIDGGLYVAVYDTQRAANGNSYLHHSNWVPNKEMVRWKKDAEASQWIVVKVAELEPEETNLYALQSPTGTYFNFTAVTPENGTTTYASFQNTPSFLYKVEDGNSYFFEDMNNPGEYVGRGPDGQHWIVSKSNKTLWNISEPDGDGLVTISRAGIQEDYRLGHDKNTNENTGIFTNVGSACNKWKLVPAYPITIKYMCNEELLETVTGVAMFGTSYTAAIDTKGGKLVSYVADKGRIQVENDIIFIKSVNAATTITVTLADAFSGGTLTIGDWKINYEPATNGIKLTGVAEGALNSGALNIGSQYIINGEPKNVVAISPDFLHGNTDVTSVTFPSTLANLGFRKVEPMFVGKYEGQAGDGVTDVVDGDKTIKQGTNRCYIFPNDPHTGKPFMINEKTAWRLTLDVTIDNVTDDFNQHGSAIVSTKANSLDDYYTNHMQIYLHDGHKDIIVKMNNSDDRYKYNTYVLDGTGNETNELLVNTHFKFELEHDGTGGYQIVIYYENGKAKMYNITADNNIVDFDRLYYSLPEGIHVDVKFDRLVSEGLFVGCTSLQEIIVDPANPTFKSCEHGVLYDKNGYYVMRIPEGETGHHFEIPSKVVKLYAGAVHGVTADIVLHSNPDIGKVEGHDEYVKNAKFYLSLDDIDPDQSVGGARDFVSANTNTYQSANYKRAPLKAGVYGTICLPFAIVNDVEEEDVMDKYDFFKFKSGNATSLTFSQVTELKANDPYLYKLKEGVASNYNLVNGYDVFKSTGEVTIVTKDKYDPKQHKPGTYHALGSFVNYYVETAKYPNSAFYYYSLSQEKFLKVTEKLTYRPYRAFFVVTPEVGGASQAPARLSLCLLDGTTTDIDASLVEGMETPVYYDLSGRRVLNPGSGVYIVNGKKVFIK